MNSGRKSETESKTSEKREPLSRLRETLRDAADADSVRAFMCRVEGDERIGAQALHAQAQRRLETECAEIDRLARLLELRNELAASGVQGIAGIDEVGVGPLAGPVVAAAVVLPEVVSLPGLDDSKRVRPAKRKILAAEIRKIALGIGIGEVRVEEIDQIGIYQATHEAMCRAVKSLERVTKVSHLLVDARTIPGVSQPQTAIIKGDSKDASIAAASIVAKVYRDDLMVRLSERYPGFGFERHMGYGTEAHVAALNRLGPCPAHRRSFAPVEAAERRISAAAHSAARYS